MIDEVHDSLLEIVFHKWRMLHEFTGHEHSHASGHTHSFPEHLHDFVDYQNQNENNVEDAIQKKFSLLKSIVEHQIHDD
ncbi:hypothetical protein Bhyg_06699 [Pseudolycoriella hygida]|uniref:Uncharacterized protein n=1 Tax=Pseudolycoriella hygida TaxID=35572 RepID=A0A9Q0S187_9DIPT|nr:hypothetical protein Bhyg_06699 [Pseudolycoriella hygida]